VDVMAAEISHQFGEFLVAAPLDQRGHLALIAELVEQALAPGAAALERQRRIELVRTSIDPLLELFAPRLGKSGFLQPAVLDDDDVPAEIDEDLLEFFPQALTHDAIERLAIIVDDPPAIAQAVLPAFDQ